MLREEKRASQSVAVFGVCVLCVQHVSRQNLRVLKHIAYEKRDHLAVAHARRAGPPGTHSRLMMAMHMGGRLLIAAKLHSHPWADFNPYPLSLNNEFQGAQPSGHGRPEGDCAFHMQVF